MNRSNLTNINIEPKVGDILFGRDAYFAQITSVSETIIEFTVIGDFTAILIDSTKYKIVGGVIRNDGTGWKFLTTGAHIPLNLESVSNDHAKITLTYGYTAVNVVTLLCTVDEVMASDKMFVGSSVGLSEALIYLYQNRSIGGYVYYNGTTWISNSDVSITTSWNAGTLTITHPAINGLKVNCSARGGQYVVSASSLGATTTQIIFKNYTGATVTEEKLFNAIILGKNITRFKYESK